MGRKAKAFTDNFGSAVNSVYSILRSILAIVLTPSIVGGREVYMSNESDEGVVRDSYLIFQSGSPRIMPTVREIKKQHY